MFERTKNDSDLLRASIQGSPKAFGVLVGRYQSLVCAITYSATSSVEKSEELAQEVFLRAWRSYREQKSIQEVAEQFGLTENTARQRISRGRKLLRKQVAHMVETTLARTRPGKAFTTAVLVCIAGTAGKSSAAVAVVGAASAAGQSAGIASLLSGASAKIAAVAAALALVTAGFLAYRQSAKSAEPAGPDLAASAISGQSLTETRPGMPFAAVGTKPDATRLAEPRAGVPALASLMARTRDLSPIPEQAKPAEFKARGVLSGLVTDIETGAPIQNAVVRISLPHVYHCRTDANGFYSLESIPQAGTANVTVESNEYLGASAQDEKREVPLSPDKQAVQHFQMRRVN